MLKENRISSDVLEKNNIPYYLITPFTWLLIFWVILKKKIFDKKQCDVLLLFDGLGKLPKIVKKNAKGWKAVDLIYNHAFGEDKSLAGRLSDFWFNNLNCQAARNRFKIAKKVLEQAVSQFPTEKEIRLASLAAGTGQIESETVAKLKLNNITVKAVLIDRDKEALNQAQVYISKNNVHDRISTINVDAECFIEIAVHFKPHIIQVIALLDYFSDKEAIIFISKLYESLPVGGVLIATNTMPNIEMHFVKWVVGWSLIYRNLDDIGDLVKKSGFNNYELMSEPLKIQGFVIARK